MLRRAKGVPSVVVRIALLLMFPVVILPAVAFPMNLPGGGAGVAEAGGPPVISLDLDITDGACTDIDASATVTQGTQVSVAVCLVNGDGVQVAAFQYQIVYNDAFVAAPEVADVAPALDDNPNANAGVTTFTSAAYPNALGTGWDCSGGVGAYPKGDVDGPFTGTGTAFSGGCGSAAGPNTLITGPLGVVTFDTVAPGVSALTLTNASVTDNDLLEIGSCNPAVDAPATCNNGSITVNASGGPTNTPQPGATNTPAPAATATPCTGTCPTATQVTSDRPATSTATGTAVADTPVPGATQAPAGEIPPPPPPPPGGGNAGVITGPDTGTGGGNSGGGSGVMWLSLLAAGSAALFAGVTIGWRRKTVTRDR